MSHTFLLQEILAIDLEQATPDSLVEQFSQLFTEAHQEYKFYDPVEQNQQLDSNATNSGPQDTILIRLSENRHLTLMDTGFSDDQQKQIKNLILSVYQYVLNRVSNITQNDLLSEKSLDADRSINPYTVDLMASRAKIGAWTLDLSNDQLYWSKAVREIHAVDEDFIPRVDTAINYYKEGWSRDRITECVSHGMETGEPWDEELIIVDANGTEKWVRAIGKAFNVGENQVLSGIFQDISDYKELIDNLEESHRIEEEKSRRLQLAVQSAKIGFWDFSIATGELSWDSGMFDIYGTEPEHFNSLFGDWSKHVHPDDLESATNAMQRTLETDENFDSEFRIIHTLTGDEKIIKANAQVIRDSSGQPIRMVGVNADVTEERTYIKKQEEIAQLAYEASQAKSQFLASISHEIRTPLNGVIGMLGLPQEESLDEQVMSKVSVADKSAHSLLALINDLLDLSKIEDGKMDIEAVDFPLQHTVDMMTDIFRYQIEEKGLTFNVNNDFSEQVIINSDPTRLRQITVNLLSNAFKFTDQGHISLSIQLHDSQEETQLNISVSDSGIGIPKELHEKLFDRFTQADSSTTRKFGGTGLGLAITRNLVELMDGTIELHSEVGKGTKFSIQIPVTINRAKRYEAPKKVEVNDFAKAESIHELGHILIVEDNKVNQMVVKAQLKSHCNQITIVENGQQAVEVLQSNESQFDMILMDCEMPVMDGYEATAAIRKGDAGKSNHAIPIIALTAKAYEEDKKKCFSVGMNGFVSKPINVDHLLEEMYRLL